MAKIYKNQTKLTVNFSLTADITNYSSVTAAVRDPVGNSGTSWPLTVVTASTGACSFSNFTTTTWSTFGTWLVQPEVTFTDGTKIKGETDQIRVYAVFE